MLIVGSGYTISQRLGDQGVVEAVIRSDNRGFLSSFTKAVYFDYTNSEKSNLFCSIAEKWKGSHFRDGSLTRLFQCRRYPGLQGF